MSQDASKTSDKKGPEVQPFRLPTQEEMQAQDMFNNCAVRTVVSGVMGGVAGLFMGALFGGLDAPIEKEGLKFSEKVLTIVKSTGSKSLSMAGTFAVMGAIFSGAECTIEKVRAKHDAVNTLFAGCVTGAAISYQAGPKAACVGCAGFAGFSLLIEKVMERTGHH